MKKLLIILPTALAMASLLTVAAKADDEKTVTANVTPITIAMGISTNSVSYGSLQAGAPEVPSSPSQIDIFNQGSVVQDFDIKGGDSSNGWTIASTPGLNQFLQTFSTGSTAKALTKTYQDLLDGVAVGGEINLFLKFTMPTSYNTTGAQSFPVMIRATMH